MRIAMVPAGNPQGLLQAADRSLLYLLAWIISRQLRLAST